MKDVQVVVQKSTLVGMRDFPSVLPTSEARAELSDALRRFRRDGLAAKPLVFGGHRKPEAVVIPFALYERLLEAIDDEVLSQVVDERLGSGKPRHSFDSVVEDLGFDVGEFE